MKHWRIVCFGMALASATLLAGGARGEVSPSTQPSATPTTNPSSDAAQEVRRAYAGLADRDPAVRDHSRRDLLGMPADRLPLLQQLVRDKMPLPAQAEDLHDIVTHVFLAGSQYERADEGFLGLFWDPLTTPVFSTGVPVMHRVPGFCGYRAFDDGDLLLGYVAGEFVPFNAIEDVRRYVRTCRPGDVVDFVIVRDAKVMHVLVPLSARPALVGENVRVQEFTEDRAEKANDYWHREFEPLLAAHLL